MIIDRVCPPFPVSIFHLRTSATIARKGNFRTKKANSAPFLAWKSNFVGISIIWPPFLNSSEYLHFYGCKCRPWPVFLLKSERSHPLFCPGGSVRSSCSSIFVCTSAWYLMMMFSNITFLLIFGCLGLLVLGQDACYQHDLDCIQSYSNSLQSTHQSISTSPIFFIHV